MEDAKQWFYDYNNKCECSDDDACGCSYPNNMSHGVDYEIVPTTEDKSLDLKYKKNSFRYIRRLYISDIPLTKHINPMCQICKYFNIQNRALKRLNSCHRGWNRPTYPPM